MIGKKIEEIKYINICNDDTEETFWIDNTAEAIAGYILNHKEDFICFYDIDNIRLFHWNGKSLVTTEFELELIEGLSSYRYQILKLLQKDLPEPILYERVEKVAGDYLCLYRQAIEGEEEFHFLSAKLHAEKRFVDMLNENDLNEKEFMTDCLFMCIPTYIGNMSPNIRQLFRFKDQKFVMKLDYKNNICYFDIS